MSNQYRVGPNGGVSFGAVYVGPNVVIRDGLMSDELCARLLRDRLIVRVGEAALPSAPVAPPPAVGVGEDAFWKRGADASISEPSGGSANDRARLALAKLAQDREAGLVPDRAPAQAVEMLKESPPAPAAVWAHDPDGLIALPVEDLRQLVLDVDPTIEVNHLDEVELIAILSSEYVAPKVG